MTTTKAQRNPIRLRDEQRTRSGRRWIITVGSRPVADVYSPPLTGGAGAQVVVRAHARGEFEGSPVKTYLTADDALVAFRAGWQT